MYEKPFYICISLYTKNFLIFGEKMVMSAELKGCVMWFVYFLDLLLECIRVPMCAKVCQVSSL